jgi:hypothetical protein
MIHKDYESMSDEELEKLVVKYKIPQSTVWGGTPTSLNRKEVIPQLRARDSALGANHAIRMSYLSLTVSILSLIVSIVAIVLSQAR